MEDSLILRNHAHEGGRLDIELARRDRDIVVDYRELSLLVSPRGEHALVEVVDAHPRLEMSAQGLSRGFDLLTYPTKSRSI